MIVCGALQRKSAERGPCALPAHYEINGRDLKSGKLDAARAAKRGAGVAATNRDAARAHTDVEGRTTAPPDIIFLKNVIFFFPTRQPVRSTDSGSEMNARVNCTLAGSASQAS